MFKSCQEGQNKRHSVVAQLVEQVTVNHPVGGSSPSHGARNKEKGVVYLK